MTRRLILAPLLLLAGCASQSEFAFPKVDVTLPDDDTTLPEGAGVDLVTANCTGCHSPSMILTQPRLSRAAWEGEVTKMAKVYRAPVAEADMPAIVDYLVATNERLTK